jgi:hypothetical protein
MNQLIDFYSQQYQSILTNGWQMAVIVILPYVLSINTMISMTLVGRLKVSGWVFQLVGQVGWLIWMVVSQNYGFLLLNAFMWYVIIKNIYVWRKNPPKI